MSKIVRHPVKERGNMLQLQWIRDIREYLQDCQSQARFEPDTEGGGSDFETACLLAAKVLGAGGLFLAEPVSSSLAHTNMSDSELLLAVLSNCGESTLNRLIDTFGAQSRLSDLINEKIRKTPPDGTEDSAIRSIGQMLAESKKSGNRLYKLLCGYMEEKGYATDAEFYKSIRMPRQIFARIRDVNKTLSKQNILLIIVGLGLNYPQAVEFLHEAGYSFRPTNKRDIILSYLFQHMTYDLDQVNEILDYFGEKTLIDVRGD